MQIGTAKTAKIKKKDDAIYIYSICIITLSFVNFELKFLKGAWDGVID